MKLNKNFRGRAFRTASLAALIASIAMPSGVSAFTYPLGSGYLYRQIDGSVTSVTSKYAPTYYNTGNYSAADPLGAATHFHIFASDDVRIGAHTNGNVATKYMSIAGSNSGTNGLDTVNLESEVSYVRDFENINGQILNNGNSPLVVGADVEVDTYNNGNGFTVKGSTMDYPVQMNNSVIKNIFQEVSGGAEYIEMDKEFVSLKQLSKGLTTVDATDDESVLDASDNNHRWINLDMSKDYSLIDFDAYQLQQNTDLVLNNYDPDGSNSVIINVDLKDFSGSSFDMNSKVFLKTVDGTEVHNKERTTWEYGKILWNFYDSSEADYCYDGKININGVFMGSILAPEAEVAVWQNHDGTTVCRSFENHAQTHRADFTGNMPIIAYSDDETTETTTETTTTTVATTQTTTVATTETTTQATTTNTTEVTTASETESSTEDDKAAQKDKTTETTTVAATEETTKTKATTDTTVATKATATTEESTSETTTKSSHSGSNKTTTTTTVTTQTTTEQTTETTTSDNTDDKSAIKDRTSQTTTEVTTETTTIAVDSKETTTVNDVTTEKQTEITTEKQPEVTSTEDSASTSTTEEESETTTENTTTESTTKKDESETEESTSGQALVVDITTTTETTTQTEISTEATTEETTETTTDKSSQSSGGSKDKSVTTETTTAKEEASTEATTSIGDAVTDITTETTTVGDGQSSSANKDKNDGDDKSGSASSDGSSSGAVDEATTYLTVTDAELTTETTTESGKDSESSVRRNRGGSSSNKASVETSSETTTASSKSVSDRSSADPTEVISDNVSDDYSVAESNTELDTETTTDVYVAYEDSDNVEPTSEAAPATGSGSSDSLPQTGSIINTAVMCGSGIGVICLGIFLVIKGKKKAF